MDELKIMEVLMKIVRLVAITVAAVGCSVAFSQSSGDKNTAYGYVSDTHCGCKVVNPDTSKPTHEECIDECRRKDSSVKYSFCREYRQYVMNDQTLGARYAGKRVKINGQFDDTKNTVEVASIELPSDTTPMYATDGWVVDDKCGAKGANSGSEACTKKCLAAGAKMVIVTDKDQKVLLVENPDALRGHEGHHISVAGQVKGDSIHIESAKML